MQSREDLLDLLNFAKSLAFEVGEERPIKMNTLTWYADHRLSGQKRYTTFSIPKKSGGERIICAPTGALKTVQRCLNLIIQVVFDPHAAAHGFVPGKSILTNAKAHVGKLYVYNLDLKDFFPSIELRRVKKCLELPPFNLSINPANTLHQKDISANGTIESSVLEKLNQAAGIKPKQNREQLAYLIANLCCTVDENNRAFLPQGAPTSPIITNIVCQKLDRRLNGLAKRFGAAIGEGAIKALRTLPPVR